MTVFEGYRVTSPFGWRQDPINGSRAYHTGIDLVKGHRAPILAFVSGVVIHARMGQTGTGFGGYGNVVAVKDKNGYLHCYCHLDEVLVSVGQTVEKGQVVGLQGSTGRSTGSHLHYEVRCKCEPSFGWKSHVDPTEYLQKYESEEKQMKKTNFPDVPAGHWAENVIAVVSKAGIMTGYEDGTFRPDKPVTRAELAKVCNDLLYLVNEKTKDMVKGFS